MSKKLKITLATLLVGLGVLAGGAWAWDSSQSDTLASGITLGGVDVGGMSRTEAEAAVRRHIVEPQRKPVTVKFRGEKFRLPAKRLKIHTDIDRVVNEAFSVSRSGSMPSRVFRRITGGSLDRNIPIKVEYSKSAVNRFVREVAEGIASPAVDATVEPTGDKLTVVPGQDGYKLRDNKLSEQLHSLLESGSGKRVLKAETNKLKPTVTVDDVAREYPTYLTLNRATFKLKLWKDLKLSKTYTVSVGSVGYDTPSGLYTIQNKAVDPAWTVPNSDWAGDLAGQVIPGGAADNPLKARWMGIYDGAGIHGTAEEGSIGSAASHGCVRMRVNDVVDLYERVDVGTPIYIQ